MSGGAPIQGRILFLHVFKKSRYQGFRGVHGKENARPFYVPDTVSGDELNRRGKMEGWPMNRLALRVLAVASFWCTIPSACHAGEEVDTMSNERLTEGIVRDHFKSDAHFQSIKWDEQKTANKRIADLLKGQSKRGGKGDGRPEFIISFPQNSNYIIVVECKAQVSKHRSPKLDKPRDFAVDGVLHYAKALSKEFSVIAIAVSGEKQSELVVSHFYWKKSAKKFTELPDEKLLPIGSYLQVFADQFFISDFFFRDIASKARELNERLYQFSIKELSRCTIVSAVLLALKDEHFVQTYAGKATAKELGDAIIAAIDATFKAEGDADENDMVRNASLLLHEFQKILNEPLFTQNELSYDKGRKKENTLVILKDLIVYLQTKIYPLVQHANVGYDVIGLFYTEFIRYAGSEQKLGLVLTPGHVTELFCDLADLRADDIVYDPCCGTGGFIVAAIERLFKLAGNDQAKRKAIKRKQICGCELRSDMYTFACSNMRFRGDGKSNLYNGDCFNHETIIRENHGPTVAFLNPPYGKTVSSARQMEFVEHALKSLNPTADGRVVAIVQMSCAIKDDKELKSVKERILKKHHLKAVLSMPDDLFYPVGVVTCIMVFEANRPNKGRKTWFGYFKDDGFEKRKGLGRIDARNRYADIKKRWLAAYRNLDEIPGLSVRKEVTAKDEWCAETYMETDYSTLTDSDFIAQLRDYAAFRVAQSRPPQSMQFSSNPISKKALNLNVSSWKWFSIEELFGEPISTKGTTTTDMNAGDDIVYIAAKKEENGVKGRFALLDNEPYVSEGNCIVFIQIGEGSAGFSTYQPYQFIGMKGKTSCGYDVEHLNPYTGNFLVTILDKERPRYCFGRSWTGERLKKTRIRLPATPDGKPDWKWMENYIKGLPYSAAL